MNLSPAICLSSAPASTAFTLNPLGATAAEISGLDCAQAMDPFTLPALREAFLTYPVLIFRDQVLSAPELAAFGRLFGPLETYENAAAKAARPPLALLHEKSGRTTPDQILYVHPEDAGVLIMTNEALPDLTRSPLSTMPSAGTRMGHTSPHLMGRSLFTLCKIRPPGAVTRNSAICA